MPKELWERLSLTAMRLRISKAEVIRKAIQNFVAVCAGSSAEATEVDWLALIKEEHGGLE